MIRKIHFFSSVVLLGLAACDGDPEATGGGGEGAGAVSSGSPASGPGATNGPSSSGSQQTTAATGSTSTGQPPTSFAEMCAAPGVVFCDGFEGSWDSTWMEDGGDVSIVAGAAVDGEGSSVIELATYEDIQSSKLLRTFAGADRIHIRFDVQYDAAYDNSGGSHGPILGGSDAPPWGMFGTAGIKPNGSDFFVLNFEPDGIVGRGGELGFYAYFVNMEISGDGNYWGNIFTSTLADPPQITPGAWQCTEYSLTLNDPGSQNGSADFWIEGVHQGTFAGLEWRTDPSLRISTFALDSYNHMNEGPIPASEPNLVRYDNFVISTEPVGCLD